MKFFCLTAIFLLLTPVMGGAETLDRIAAVVNQNIITTYQLQKAMADSQAENAKEAEGSDAKGGDELQRQVLSKLIEDDLVQQRIDELKIEVSDDEIEGAIRDVETQNKLTPEQLEAALQAQGMTMAEYRQNLRRQILRYKLLGREVQSKVEVTNQDLLDYFREHIAEYRGAPYVRLSRISFLVPDKASTAEIDAVHNKAEAALALLQGGEDFNAVLLSYSSDKNAIGGDMGEFSEGQLTPAFAQAIRNLKEGEITGIIETPGGFHILKITELSKGKIRKFDTVKEEIRKILQEEKSKERYQEWAAGLKKNAYIDIRL
jgi:peptidyl-prolyl cis-trans isomerase SurA